MTATFLVGASQKAVPGNSVVITHFFTRTLLAA